MKRGFTFGVLGVGSSRLFALLAQTVASILVARELGPENYGQLAFVLAVINLAALPVTGGLNPLLVREVAKSHAGKNWDEMSRLLNGAYRWVGRNSVLVLLLVLGAVAAFPSYFAEGRAALFLIAGLLIPLWGVVTIRTAVLQGLGRVVQAQMADWLFNPAFYLFAVVLLWYGNVLTDVSALVAAVCASAVGLLSATIALKNGLPHQICVSAGSQDYPWFRMLLPFGAIHALMVGNTHLVPVVLGVISNDTAVGLYRVADAISMLVPLSLIVVNAVAAPQVVRLYAAGELEKLQHIARTSARTAFALTIPLVVLMLAAGNWLIELVFGVEYGDAYPAVLILLLGQIVNVSCGSVNMLLNMAGMEHESMYALLGAVVINMILCALLIPGHAEIGAAISAAVSLTAWNLWLLWRVRVRIGVWAAVI